MENNYEFPISHNKFLEITSCTSEKSRGPVNTAKREMPCENYYLLFYFIWLTRNNKPKKIMIFTNFMLL